MRPAVAVLVITFFLSSLSLWAQLPTATLNGIVTDPQGALVAGAKIAVTNQATGVGRDTTTGSDGHYVVANLPPGRYNVRVEASGFSANEYRDIVLEVGRATTVDAGLKLAKVGEVVTVTGGETQVELTQSEVQGQITAQTVQSIPLNGRNFLELAFLIPGNRPATNFDPTKTNTLEVSSAGQFGRGGNITVDGGDNNDEVVGGTLMNFPQDGVGEFQIATNRYTAEVGRSASSIINIVTKSGGNDFHGSLFGYLRNRKLQAKAAILPAGAPKPHFDRQQFGGSLGGALVRDRAWWFVSGEDRNQHGDIQVGSRDFTQRKVVAGSASAPLDDALILARQDVKLNDRDTVAIRWGFNRSLETANGSLRKPLGSAANRQSSLNRFNSVLGEWTRTVSPHLVNSAIFHVNTFLNEIPSFPNNKAATVPDLGLTNELRFPSLQDGGNFRIPQRTRLQRYQGRETLAWTHGSHAFHFGGEVQKQFSDALFDLFGSSTIFLSEDFATQDRTTGTPLAHAAPPDDRDIPVAIAIRSTAPIRPPFVPDINSSYFGVYVQDDWRARPNLTFNLGLRYEVDTDVFGQGPNHKACPTPLTQKPTSPCVWTVGFLGLHRNRDLKDFSPRVGFAWDPFSNGRTVVRGGYGIYYDRVVLEVRLLELLLDGRQLSLQGLGGSTLDPVTGRFRPDPKTGQIVSLQNPFAGAPFPLSIGINVLDNNIAHPYTQQFSFGIQQQLGKDWLVSADGLHDFGSRFLLPRLLRNSASCPAGSLSTARCPVNVTDPLTGLQNTVVDIGSFGKTWYDGLVASLQKRPSAMIRGWSYGFNANYTWSKSLGFANDDQIPFNGPNHMDEIFNVQNLRLEKGYSPTDERHRFTLFGSVSAPFDITISPILTVSSSVPSDTVDPDPALGGGRLPLLARNGLGRQVTNGTQLNALIQKWNSLPPCPAGGGVFPCFLGSTPLQLVDPTLRFGDTFISADLRVSKAIRINERHRVEAIAEVFNLANNVNIRGFNNNNYPGRSNSLGSCPAAGACTQQTGFYRAFSTAGGNFGSGGPRAFQFALRYSF